MPTEKPFKTIYSILPGRSSTTIRTEGTGPVSNAFFDPSPVLVAPACHRIKGHSLPGAVAEMVQLLSCYSGSAIPVWPENFTVRPRLHLTAGSNDGQVPCYTGVMNDSKEGASGETNPMCDRISLRKGNAQEQHVMSGNLYRCPEGSTPSR